MAGHKLMGTLATVAMLLLGLHAGLSSCFTRIMMEPTYCETEGSFCWSDASCCKGLVCHQSQEYTKVGGLCHRSFYGNKNYAAHDASPFESAATATRTAATKTRYCQTDADCHIDGQCCRETGRGFRGHRILTCGTHRGLCDDGDQDDRQIGDILGEFYSRYYRRLRKAF